MKGKAMRVDNTSSTKRFVNRKSATNIVDAIEYNYYSVQT